VRHSDNSVRPLEECCKRDVISVSPIILNYSLHFAMLLF